MYCRKYHCEHFSEHFKLHTINKKWNKSADNFEPSQALFGQWFESPKFSFFFFLSFLPLQELYRGKFHLWLIPNKKPFPLPPTFLYFFYVWDFFNVNITLNFFDKLQTNLFCFGFVNHSSYPKLQYQTVLCWYRKFIIRVIKHVDIGQTPILNRHFYRHECFQ